MDHNYGFSLIEVVVALAVIGTVFVVISSGILYANNSLTNLYPIAQSQLTAHECLEGVRWIRDANGYSAVTIGTWELQLQSGQWQLMDQSFSDPASASRKQLVTIESYDSQTKKITCAITWHALLGDWTTSLITLLVNR